jgi:hypothetical protein
VSAVGIGETLGGGGAITQIFTWQVAAQIVQSLMSPTLELVAQKVNAENPVIDLSPADLAQLVVRNYRSMGEAASEAARSGIDAAKFADLVHIAGDAPGPSDLAVALRRGLIPEGGTGPGVVSFEAGIREGRLADKWTAMVKELAVQWPSPTDALDALLEGQISQADAQALYRKLGGDPQFFTLLFNTRGSAPTPVEALEMANRGIIPWTGTGPDVTSFEQAFLEGPWRNKWEKAYRGIGDYLPPPRTVTAMVHNGSLTEAQALALLVKQGLSQELAAAYVHDALNSKTSHQRDLTVAQILDMYGAGMLAGTDAKSLLVALKYSEDSASELLAYKDLQRAIAAVNQAVARIHTLYVSHKIDRANAGSTLTALSVPGDQITRILATWDLERAVNVKVLTPAQIVDAWKVGIIDQGEATDELVGLGYTPRDAWILLSLKNKAPLGSAPAQGPAPLSPTGAST